MKINLNFSHTYKRRACGEMRRTILYTHKTKI